MWYLVSNIIDSTIVMLLVYLPIVLAIIGIVSFICFLILKYKNNRKYFIFLMISISSFAIIGVIFLFFVIAGIIGFGPID
jgi:hypothetical protein